MDLNNKAKDLRKDIVKMIHLAKSGHPGGSLSCLEILMSLYYKKAKIDPTNPHWEERDRIILSKGHAAPAIYAILADLGYFPKEDLWSLRKTGCHLQGHPDMKKTPGVDMSTGSLGQGVAVAVGMALSFKHQKKDNKVYAIVGDGELQEGQVWEAAMSAAHYKLDNLTILLDKNNLQIDGSTENVMSLGNVMDKFKAFGFSCHKVDGHNIEEIILALEVTSNNHPKFICCNTTKGYGISFMENNYGWHGKAPSADDYEKSVAELSV